jgi:hypothetical protein
MAFFALVCFIFLMLDFGMDGCVLGLIISVCCQTGKKQSSSKTTKKRSSIAAPLKQLSYRTLDCGVDIMHLVREVTRSKDETIRAKDQMIKLLEERKMCVCANGLGAVE